MSLFRSLFRSIFQPGSHSRFNSWGSCAEFDADSELILFRIVKIRLGAKNPKILPGSVSMADLAGFRSGTINDGCDLVPYPTALTCTDGSFRGSKGPYTIFLKTGLFGVLYA